MARVRGSKNGEIITAKFKGQAKSFFPTLKQTKALVLLSVIGNEFCEGDYLKSIIDIATNAHGFTSFLIADEVYWHNLCEHFSIDEEPTLRKKARELGKEYFEKNIAFFLSPLNISLEDFYHAHRNKPVDECLAIINGIAKKHSNFEVVTWNNWINKSKKFEEIKSNVKELFENEKVLIKSVEQTANNFASRNKAQHKSYDILKRRSRNYLIDESVTVMWIAASLDYNFVAYPGEMIKPFRAVKEFFIKEDGAPKTSEYDIHVEDPKLLVNWLEITFQRSHKKNSKLNTDKVNAILTQEKKQLTDSEILKGVTQGLFSLEIDPQMKVKYLVDFIEEFNARRMNLINTKEAENRKVFSQEILDYLLEDIS